MLMGFNFSKSAVFSFAFGIALGATSISAQAQNESYRFTAPSAKQPADTASQQTSRGLAAPTIYNRSKNGAVSSDSMPTFSGHQNKSSSSSIYVKPKNENIKEPQKQSATQAQTNSMQSASARSDSTHRLKLIRPTSGAIQTSGSDANGDGRIEYGNVFDTLRSALPASLNGASEQTQSQTVSGVRVQDGSDPAYPIGMNHRVVNQSLNGLQAPTVNAPEQPQTPQVKQVSEPTASMSSSKKNPAQKLNLLHDMITKTQMGSVSKPRTTGGLRAGGTTSSAADSAEE